MPTDKRATSYRLSDEARAAIDRLTGLYGCSAASVIERGVLLLDRLEPIIEDAGRKVLAEMPAPPADATGKPRGRPRKDQPSEDA